MRSGVSCAEARFYCAHMGELRPISEKVGLGLIFSSQSFGNCYWAFRTCYRSGIRFGRNSPILGGKRQDQTDPPMYIKTKSSACMGMANSGTRAFRDQLLNQLSAIAVPRWIIASSI